MVSVIVCITAVVAINVYVVEVVSGQSRHMYTGTPFPLPPSRHRSCTSVHHVWYWGYIVEPAREVPCAVRSKRRVQSTNGKKGAVALHTGNSQYKNDTLSPSVTKKLHKPLLRVGKAHGGPLRQPRPEQITVLNNCGVLYKSRHQRVSEATDMTDLQPRALSAAASCSVDLVFVVLIFSKPNTAFSSET